MFYTIITLTHQHQIYPNRCAVGLPDALVLGRPDLPSVRTLRLLGHPSVRASRVRRLQPDVPVHLQTGLPQGIYPYIFRQVYLKVCSHTSSDISTSRYLPIHLQTGLPEGMHPYIFRQVYLKVCTHTSSHRSTSRYVPIHLHTGLTQGMYPYIFTQVYLKVCTHTSSDRSTSRYVPIHLHTGLAQGMYPYIFRQV